MPLASKAVRVMPWRARGEYKTLEGALGAAARTSAESGYVAVRVLRGARAFVLFLENDPAPVSGKVVATVVAEQGATTGSRGPNESAPNGAPSES